MNPNPEGCVLCLNTWHLFLSSCMWDLKYISWGHYLLRITSVWKHDQYRTPPSSMEEPFPCSIQDGYQHMKHMNCWLGESPQLPEISIWRVPGIVSRMLCCQGGMSSTHFKTVHCPRPVLYFTYANDLTTWGINVWSVHTGTTVTPSYTTIITTEQSTFSY